MRTEFAAMKNTFRTETVECGKKATHEERKSCEAAVKTKEDAEFANVQSKEKLAQELTENEKVALKERIEAQKAFDKSKNDANAAY